jgi:hypothetical protein
LQTPAVQEWPEGQSQSVAQVGMTGGACPQRPLVQTWLAGHWQLFVQVVSQVPLTHAWYWPQPLLETHCGGVVEGVPQWLLTQVWPVAQSASFRQSLTQAPCTQLWPPMQAASEAHCIGGTTHRLFWHTRPAAQGVVLPQRVVQTALTQSWPPEQSVLWTQAVGTGAGWQVWPWQVLVAEQSASALHSFAQLPFRHTSDCLQSAEWVQPPAVAVVGTHWPASVSHWLPLVQSVVL